MHEEIGSNWKSQKGKGMMFLASKQMLTSSEKILLEFDKICTLDFFIIEIVERWLDLKIKLVELGSIDIEKSETCDIWGKYFLKENEWKMRYVNMK